MKIKLSLLIACMWVIALTTVNAEDWLTDAATGCMVWNPNPQTGEVIEWYGSIETNKANGCGIAVWKNKGQEIERAAGEWKNGKLHGVAVWSSSAGAQYAGEWKNGTRTGFGIYTAPDGSIFIGEFSNGQQVMGRTVDPDGKRMDSIESALVRKIIYQAQDAAIRARKASAEATAKDKRRRRDDD